MNVVYEVQWALPPDNWFNYLSYILKRNGDFFVCPAHYLGTGKGYKLEIWQESVVSNCNERYKIEPKARVQVMRRTRSSADQLVVSMFELLEKK